MAQMTERSKPQHYNIVGKQSGAILATVSYSKAQSVKIFKCWYGVHTQFKVSPIEVCAWNKTEARKIYANQMGYPVSKVSGKFVRELA